MNRPKISPVDKKYADFDVFGNLNLWSLCWQKRLTFGKASEEFGLKKTSV